MKWVIDIETNRLENPDKIWLIVSKNIDTGEYSIFRNITEDKNESERFISFHEGIVRSGGRYIGHNCLGFDWPILVSTLKLHPEVLSSLCIDTLIVSKLVDYSRQGHSLEDYGLEFGYPKLKFSDFSKYSKEMEEYCIRDVDITHKIYLKYLKIIEDPNWYPSISLEHKFQLVVNDLSNNGFSFNTNKANKLLDKISKELEVLDKDILSTFPPRQILVREFTPRATKHGTINKSSVPRSLHHCISDYEIGVTYPVYREEAFNPSSHKQIIEVLSEAGWSPTDKTKTHLETEREYNRLRYRKTDGRMLDLRDRFAILKDKLENLKKTGWKINENNLSTLPDAAPAPARLLAKRILLESRRRSLTEWLSLVKDDGRIHGKFYGLGAWTHRMAHQNPNTANIPTDARLYGGDMRALWQAPRNRLLVGVDAEGIQLRIFAHYINDPEFTNALVTGRKEDKTDPHSLNQRIIGNVCRSRQDAKRFIYSLLLGAGTTKLAEILGSSVSDAEEALNRVLERYQGFAYLKENVIPNDAERGYFIGLDGRRVNIPGETKGARRHLCLSGYLQNGEAIIMKRACLRWHELLVEKFDGSERAYLESSLADLYRSSSSASLPVVKTRRNIKLVNFVHDEWQTEVPNDVDLALEVAATQAESFKIVGEELGLKCPLAGSYWNDDLKDNTIGINWHYTH